MINKGKSLTKALRASLNPSHWRALRNRVVPTIEHAGILASVSPASIIDVGANKGQFSSFSAAKWPTAEIWAFEPIPDQACRYRAVLGNRAKLFEYALGDTTGEATLHVASRVDSSSLLPLAEQAEIFAMGERETIQVPVTRLDEALCAGKLTSPALLKVDVQGFEYEVLKGAEKLIPQIEWIFVEVSFVELYSGQKLFGEVTEMLDQMGYTLETRSEGATDAFGREVQADALYRRK